MRHLLANIATYAIAALLFIGAAGFAWMRSTQLAIATESQIVARHAPSPAHEFEWHELGERSYTRNCSNCHRPDGSGWDQYPPLSAVGSFVHAPNGRDYLIDLHIYGLSSPRWGAPMPPMGHIDDVELAAVINYVLTNFGNEHLNTAESLFIPSEIAERRGRRVRPRDVNELRQSSALGADNY